MTQAEETQVANDFIEMLITINHKFYRRMSLPLPLNQFAVLMVIYTERELTIKEIVDIVAISKQQMTSIIEKLAAAQLITRKHDPADRRRSLVAITGKGEQFVHDQNDFVRRRFVTNLKDFSENEKEELATSIEKLKSYLEQMQEATLEDAAQQAEKTP